jgi:ABC-type uncharacterized transport system auxiliary subunit
MQRLTQLVPIVLVTLGLCGCGSSRPIKYYGLRIPAAPTPSPRTYPIDLAVGRLQGPSLLEAAPIVYRTSANEMGTYTYHRWEDAPVELVQAKLIHMLRSTGLYQSVGGLATTVSGEFVVRGRLYHFEEADADVITTNVAMELELYNRKSGKVVWSHFYSQTEPVEGKQLPAVVAALDRNLERGLQEVVSGLGQYFAANPPRKHALTASDQQR